MDKDTLDFLKELGNFGLLALILWYSLTRGLPYIFEKQNERLKEQDIVYKESLTKISDSFITYMEKSMGWHEQHSKGLESVDEKVDKIIKYQIKDYERSKNKSSSV